ncbi:MAG: S8 family peptidase [Acidobacteria bacterium]|nr:S8 family peptidase [Acidobacteriota bacterium]
MRHLRLAFCALALVALAGGPSFAQGKAPARKPVLDQALSGAGQPDDLLRVIVKYRAGAYGRLKSKVRSQSEGIKGEHRGIGALTVALRRANLNAVCSDPDVLGCSLDAPVRANAQETTDSTTDSSTTDTSATGSSTDTVTAEPVMTTDADTSTYDAQHLRATLGIEPWDMGWDVGIAVIDSGIARVADLAYNIMAFYDFTAGGVAAHPTDAYGHGSHVAGLIAGSGELSNGKYVGVANGARLIGLKVLDAAGSGYTSDVIAAIEFAIANRESLGIHVINLSLGHPVFEPPATDPLVQAVEKAVASGIVVVVSAGNFGFNPTTKEIGYGGIASPGNAPSALTVGALRTKATADRSDDEIALFSSRGPTWYDGRIKPDVVAPGQALVAVNDPSTTLYQNAQLHADVAPYLKLSGTSMATAVTSGVVALLIEANWLDEWYASPPLTPNAVKALLQFSAIPVPQTFVIDGIPSALAEGAGGINAAGAMALARAIDPAIEVGQVWLDAAYDPYSTIAGATYKWAQHIVWGDHVVWGDSVMWNQQAWAQHVVWGDHIVWGDHVVWGDSLHHSVHLVMQSFDVWSTHIVWGDGFISGNYDDGVVWGDYDDDGVVWGDYDDGDGVVWGDGYDDGVVWGDSVLFLTED